MSDTKDTSLAQSQLMKLKKQDLIDKLQAVKILTINDESFLTISEKHNLNVIRNAANTLIESLNKKGNRE